MRDDDDWDASPEDLKTVAESARVDLAETDCPSPERDLKETVAAIDDSAPPVEDGPETRDSDDAIEPALENVEARESAEIGDSPKNGVNSVNPAADFANRSTDRGDGEREKSVDELGELIKAEFSKLNNKIDSNFKISSKKDERFDKLYDELLQYRNNIIYKSSEPFIRGIISIYGIIEKTVRIIKNKPIDKITADIFYNFIEGIQQDILILLENNNITNYKNEDNIFNPKRQIINNIITTNNKTKSSTIAERIRPGFERDGLILEKERVNVFNFIDEEQPKIDK
jgi:molecular chaperone GrpE (heat shock protein)